MDGSVSDRAVATLPPYPHVHTTRTPDKHTMMPFWIALRRRLDRVGPYGALVVLAVPLAIVEPFKLVAVLVAGTGHFVTGLVFLICAYVASLVITERLFIILKPKLLLLPWFAKAWVWFVAWRRRCLRFLRGLRAPAGRFLFGR
jgi:hypothetical protein